MAGTLAAALSAADPEHAEIYRANCEAYQAELVELDADFMALVSGAKRREICFGGRFALHYFAKRYGLSYIAAYDSCSSETEPSAKAVAEITDAILADGIPVIYYEELVDPKCRAPLRRIQAVRCCCSTPAIMFPRTSWTRGQPTFP